MSYSQAKLLLNFIFGYDASILNTVEESMERLNKYLNSKEQALKLIPLSKKYQTKIQEHDFDWWVNHLVEKFPSDAEKAAKQREISRLKHEEEKREEKQGIDFLKNILQTLSITKILHTILPLDLLYKHGLKIQ